MLTGVLPDPISIIHSGCDMPELISQEVIHALVLLARDRHVVSLDEIERRLPGIYGEPRSLDQVLSALAARGIEVIYGAPADTDHCD